MSVLAVDAGTTGVTALLVDDRRSGRGARLPGVPPALPAPTAGSSTRPRRSGRRRSRRSVPALAAGDGRACGHPPPSGVTNQRETAVLWDRETLGAPRRAIVWQDRRTAALCDELRAAGHEPRVTELTGLRLDPYFTGDQADLARRRDEPHTWAGVTSGRVAVGTVDSYLVARMTRGLHHVTDASNASRTLLFDIRRGRVVRRAVRAASGCPSTRCPRSCRRTASSGVPTRRRSSASTCPSPGSPATSRRRCSGRPASRPARRKCTYGTGSFVLVNTGDGRRCAPRRACSRRSRGDTRTGGSTTRSRARCSSPARQCSGCATGCRSSARRPRPRRIAATVPDSGGWCSCRRSPGLGAPDWDPTARGLVIGITRSHDPRAPGAGDARGDRVRGA